MNGNADQVLEVHRLEYEKLKDEQIARIEFRDHLIHVHLALVGAALGWGLTQSDYRVFLIVPWVCLVMGWTYTVNDDRISALGAYMRNELDAGLKQKLGISALLRWEWAHTHDRWRIPRKIIQLFVDLITFVASGFVALAAYGVHKGATDVWPWKWPLSSLEKQLVIGEALVLVLLGILIFTFSKILEHALPGAKKVKGAQR